MFPPKPSPFWILPPCDCPRWQCSFHLWLGRDRRYALKYLPALPTEPSFRSQLPRTSPAASRAWKDLSKESPQLLLRRACAKVKSPLLFLPPASLDSERFHTR